MKTRLTQRVFLFLLITVGIVFLVVQIRSRFAFKERFQTQTQTQDVCRAYYTKCGLYTIPDDGRKILLCQESGGQTGQEIALEFLNMCDTTALRSLDPTNLSTWNPLDAVCYSQRTSAGDVYICYDRPPPLVYDQVVGGNITQDPNDDLVPEQNARSVTDACDTYQTVTNMLFRTFSTTTMNKAKVSNGLASLKDARNQVSTLYTARCNGALTGQRQIACTSIQNFLTSTADTSNIQKLEEYETTLAAALLTMKSLYTNEIERGYNGLGCRVPSFPKPAGLA